MLTSTSIVVCPACGVPFTRTGAARSSHFYRTQAENDTCIVCREGLDPVTLEPLAARKGTMEKPAALTDAELLEALELAAARAGLAAVEDLRLVADVLAGLALEAARRLKSLSSDNIDREWKKLRGRISRLEDAAFHFQTCRICHTDREFAGGRETCITGARFAAYLRGEDDEQAEPSPRPPAPVDVAGVRAKVRNVVVHPDGRMTCELEVAAGDQFLEQIRNGARLEWKPAPPAGGNHAH